MKEPLPPLRVLIVEDSEDDALLITEELRERYDPQVKRVQDRDGMSAALAVPDWDVIISDHNLPNFSATAALQLLVESRCDIPFIIVSGTIGEEQAVEAMKAGAHDFVMKDALAKLVPAVEHAVAAGKVRRLHRQAELELKASREQLRQLTAHLEQVREEERGSLAREIHDELGGILTALKMDISWLRRRCTACADQTSDKLDSMAGLLDSAIQSTRRIITALRPSVLDDLGLVAALEWQLGEFGRRAELQTRLRIDDPVAAIAWPPELATVVFRIFQESLTNVARHAGASAVEAQFRLQPEGATLVVRDNGRGIHQEHLQKHGSFGILGMRERAHNLGGELTISSGADGGTEVRLQLPARLLPKGEHEA